MKHNFIVVVYNDMEGFSRKIMIHASSNGWDIGNSREDFWWGELFFNDEKYPGFDTYFFDGSVEDARFWKGLLAQVDLKKKFIRDYMRIGDNILKNLRPYYL